MAIIKYLLALAFYSIGLYLAIIAIAKLMCLDGILGGIFTLFFMGGSLAIIAWGLLGWLVALAME